PSLQRCPYSPLSACLLVAVLLVPVPCYSSDRQGSAGWRSACSSRKRCSCPSDSQIIFGRSGPVRRWAIMSCCCSRGLRLVFVLAHSCLPGYCGATFVIVAGAWSFGACRGW